MDTAVRLWRLLELASLHRRSCSKVIDPKEPGAVCRRTQHTHRLQRIVSIPISVLTEALKDRQYHSLAFGVRVYFSFYVSVDSSWVYVSAPACSVPTTRIHLFASAISRPKQSRSFQHRGIRTERRRGASSLFHPPNPLRNGDRCLSTLRVRVQEAPPFQFQQFVLRRESTMSTPIFHLISKPSSVRTRFPGLVISPSRCLRFFFWAIRALRPLTPPDSESRKNGRICRLPWRPVFLWSDVI